MISLIANATGPLINEPKMHCRLSGIIEPDGSTYPFTMNCQVRRPGWMHVPAGRAGVRIFPIPAAAVTEFEPERVDLADDPALKAETMAWSARRERVHGDVWANDTTTLKEGW